VDEYLVDLNATQAAVRAGYSPRTAHQAGYKLVRKGEIQAAIAAGRQRLASAAGVTAERLTAELEALAHSDVGDILDLDGKALRLRPPHDISERARRAIASIKVKRYLEPSADGSPRDVELTEVKLWSKPVAIEMLSRRFPHLFAKKHEVSGTLTAKHVDLLVAGLLVIFRRYMPADQVGPALRELRQLVEKSGGSPAVLLKAAGAVAS
jgi:phage terminase small subunit